MHAVVAAVLAIVLEASSGADALPTLNGSTLELCLEESASDAVVSEALPPSAAPQSASLSPRPGEPPRSPTAAWPPVPDPAQSRFPEPTEEVARIEASPAIAETALMQPRARIDAPPSPKDPIRPRYPRGARQRGEQGEVTLEIRVNDKGGVEAVSVVASCGFRELDEAARQAVCAARFTPARAGDASVASTVRLPFSFKLR